MKKAFKIVLPWCFCIAIFYYIFSKIQLAEFLHAFAQANIFLFVLYAILYFFLVHTFDCLAIKHFISRFSSPISHKESWLVRGVSYFIMILNYHAAQGAFAIYFKKTHKAPIAKTLGVLGFISVMDLLLVVTSAFVALSFSNITYRGFDIRSFVLKLAPLLYICYFLWIAFWRNSEKPFMDKVKKFKLIKWILHHDIFLIFREANLTDYVLIFLYRLPIIILVLGSYKFAVAAFQGELNWLPVYLYNPVILLVSSLPITPSGLGTGQLMTIAFYKDLVTSPLFGASILTPESLLFTSSLAWALANQVVKAIFGMICLTQTSRNLFEE